ncbi:MAG TPA: saccharopine dehydrogenase [Legionellales bacterium]|nr:saccharopine dehydrogenase [Legionellales bacterium]
MFNILVVGSGKIGSLVAILLSEHQDFKVTIASNLFHQHFPENILTISMDVHNEKDLKNIIQKQEIHAVISCLPFYLNQQVAKICDQQHCHYFDLTEDIEVTEFIKELATGKESIFVPQCGLAPGFVNIASEFLIQFFDDCHELRLRVGGLPQYTQNALKYALTWSLDGLINQYINPCPVIKNGHLQFEPALENLESINLDGAEYEAFNTSGGVGHLTSRSKNKVKELNYKTIRYPGHCEKIKFLLNDLKLKDDRITFARLLQKALPEVDNDVVIIFVAANGYKNEHWIEHHYFKKILPQTIAGKKWSAMQVATASSVCVVVDLILQQQKKLHGMILHEKIHFGDFMANRFSLCYR